MCCWYQIALMVGIVGNIVAGYTDSCDPVPWSDNHAFDERVPHYWIGKQDKAIKRCFLNNPESITPLQRQSALLIAVQHQNAQLCRFLLLDNKYEINVNASFCHTLYKKVLAAAQCKKVAQILINQGARVKGDTNLIFNAITLTDDSPLVKLYAECGASLVKPHGETVFHTLALLARDNPDKPVNSMAMVLYKHIGEGDFRSLMSLRYKNWRTPCGMLDAIIAESPAYFDAKHPAQRLRAFFVEALNQKKLKRNNR